jgi:predicted metalloprotease with PDZ domain
MFRIFILILLLPLSGLHAQHKLSYQFRYDTSASASSLLVQLRCKGSETGITNFKLPDSWANQQKLYRAVQNINVPGASSSRMADSVTLQVIHKPGAVVIIHYRIKQDWKGSIGHPMNYRAIIQPAYMQLTGYALFILPAMEKEDKVEIELDWSKMPEGWTIGNSLHSGSKTYSGKILAGDLQNSFYVAGDFRLHKVEIENKPVFIAIRGNEWKFSDTTLVKSAVRIIGEERKFWNEFSDPYYFISLIPFEGSGTYNGSALHQSFLMGMTKEFNVDSYIYKLLAHEYFHKWIGVNIIMKGDEQENAWFGEGFTEYYTHKLLYKAGLISEDEFIYFLNTAIADYYLSPLRHAKKEEIGKNFWTTRAYTQLPYKKGLTYALYIDEMIMKNSGGKFSLDNVMHAINDSANKKKMVTEEMFTDLVKQFSENDIEAAHKKYIHNGELLPVLPFLNGKPAKLSIHELGAFDLGFDMEASAEKRILQGIIKDGPAWKAGLRDGQQLVSWSIQYDNVSVPAEFTIKQEGSTPKKISYRAMKEEKTPVPQFGMYD